jgi:TonB family protein
MRTIAWIGVALLLGCGGSKKEAAEPTGGGEEEVSSDEGGDVGDDTEEGMIAPEKVDEINHAFGRKRPQIADCYADLVEKGKLSKKQQGRITVEVKINTSGRASEVTVSDASTLKSEPLNECIIERIKSWDLPKPNVPFQFSFAYDFLEGI